MIYAGDFDNLPTVHLTRAVLKGLLEPIVPESVNYVNAPALAASRRHQDHRKPDAGRRPVVPAHRPQAGGERPEREICGTVFSRGQCPHRPHRRLPRGHPAGRADAVTKHTDRPGIIGKVGTLLGDAGVNIAGMHVGRESGEGSTAVMVLKLDTPVPDALLDQIRQIPGMESARQVVCNPVRDAGGPLHPSAQGEGTVEDCQ